MSNGRRAAQAKNKALSSAVAAAAAAGASPEVSDDAARKAVMNVVQMWLDRLQLVSVIVRPYSLLFLVVGRGGLMRRH